VVFVYHAVPDGMVGSVLYPLTDLRRVSVDAFAAQRAKYAEREAVLDARITASGLRFNETIHCAPLHPHHLYRLRKQMGLLATASASSTEPQAKQRLFFEIPAERFREQPAYWYRWVAPWINGYPGEDVALAPPLKEFEPFDPVRYRELPRVPRAHIEYLGRAKRDGKRPLMFVHIPHILVAGPIETKGLRVVSWEQPGDIP
jgi:hypothetical protein